MNYAFIIRWCIYRMSHVLFVVFLCHIHCLRPTVNPLHPNTHTGWWQYDERTSQEIEDAYKRPDKFCTILVAGYVYVVDFETMLQQRQNEPSRKRQVKRDLATVPKKGVAGLRIDGTADPLESSSASVVVAEAAASSYPYHPFHQRDDSAGAGVVATAVATAASMTGGIGDGSPRSPLPALVAHNLISTIAATDAAIRIASDIIDSTLAHASTDTHGSSSAYDYHDGSGAIGGSISGGMAGRRANGHASSGSVNHRALSPCSNGSSRQDLLNEVQEALNISGHGNTSGNGSMGGICPSDHHHHRAGAAAAVAASSTSPRLDFFSQTIDEFRSLALSNIAESSADSDSELDDRDDGDNSRNNIGDGDNGLVVATSAAAHMGDTTSGGTINGLNI